MPAPLRVVHTADWQLGRAFHDVAGDRGALLREARLSAIERIIDVARTHDAHAIVVAGDVFDAHTVDERVVIAMNERLAAAPCPVVMIPGNHDAGFGAGTVWARASFARTAPASLIVARDTTPIPIADGAGVILPCPLLHRHSTTDPTAPLSADLGRDVARDAVRIGLAHGSTTDFSGADVSTANVIDVSCIERAELAYLALGDWHGTRMIAPRAWYAGTPETDRFRDNDSGAVLVVTLDGAAAPSVERVETSHFTWHSATRTVRSAAEVDDVITWLDALPAARSLVRLELSGALPLTECARLDTALDDAALRLTALRRRGPGVSTTPTEAELEALSGHGVTGAAVRALRERQTSDPDAEAALRLLFEIIAALPDDSVPAEVSA